jgi:hypothetical protein
MDLQTILRLSGLFDPNQSPNQGIIQQPQIDAGGFPIGSMPQLINAASQPSMMPQPIGADSPINPSLVNTEAASVPPDTGMDSYIPRHSISDKYTAGLENPPVDQSLSKWRRLAGIVSGGLMAGTSGDIAGGVKLGEHVQDYPNEKARNEYYDRMKLLGIGATEEDKANAGEVSRLYKEAQTNIGQQKADIAQQRADSYQQAQDTKELAETQKHETAMTKLKNAVEMADAKLAFANKKLSLDQNNKDAILEFKRAELDSKNARHDVEKADLEFKQGQLERRTTSIEERNKILNETNRNAPRTTTQDLYDPTGKSLGKKVTKTGPTQPSIITDPVSKQKYDTTTWSDADKAAAAAKGWK